MPKIYHVIQIQLNQFFKMSIWSLTYQQSVFKHYHSDISQSFYLQDGGKNQLADMERIYVTVILCIRFGHVKY